MQNNEFSPFPEQCSRYKFKIFLISTVQPTNRKKQKKKKKKEKKIKPIKQNKHLRNELLVEKKFGGG